LPIVIESESVVVKVPSPFDSERPETLVPGAKDLSSRPGLRRFWALALLSTLTLLCSCKRLDCPPPAPPLEGPPDRSTTISSRVDALNRLRNAVNARYGYRNGVARVNLGPCGPFARIFHTQWNARFQEKAIIAFVMTREGSFCHHILVKLPDGTFFDGGNGVITREALLNLYSGSRIDEMAILDLNLLEQRAFGLNRPYPECPDYSNDAAEKLITSHLDLLAPETDQVER
jgi:hypothetical protein